MGIKMNEIRRNWKTREGYFRGDLNSRRINSNHNNN